MDSINTQKSIVSIAVILIIIGLHYQPIVECSQRSIQLDSNGHYKGLVVSFTSDFHIDPTQRLTMVQSVMNNLQSASNVLNQLIGVQFGEVSIILPDGWNVRDQLTDVTESQYKPLQESDIIYTDEDNDQILTMQYGDCGEGALPIQFPKKYISDQYKLLAHQWLLYRYGVFNEFGYKEDQYYPVYYGPIDGGVIGDKPNGTITSCSNRPEFDLVSMCPVHTIDPNTGRPKDPKCDVIPQLNSIQSSFLYAPIQVNETDYSLCNKSTHDYVSPNKHNVMCSYQSAIDVIRQHTDFHSLDTQHRFIRQPTKPIEFKIWQNVNIAATIQPKSYMMYVFPSGFRYGERLLSIVSKISEDPMNVFEHQVRVRFYNESSQLYNTRMHDWKPSNKIINIVPTEQIHGTVKLILTLDQVVSEFRASRQSQIGGMCLFVFDGQTQTIGLENDAELDMLSERLNQANIVLRILIVGQLPSESVLRFFDKLIVSNQIFSIATTTILDSIQDLTDQSHVVLKRETFASDTTNNAGLNFTIDSSFQNLANTKYWLMIECYTSGSKDHLAETANLIDSTGTTIPMVSIIKSPESMVTILYRGNDLSIHGMNHFRFVSDRSINSLTTITVRILSNNSPYRAYDGETPIYARCWLQQSDQYPLRGYVQLSQGLNGPVYDADVSLIVRRFTINSYDELNVGMIDNGRANPDITARDGIYSSYLDMLTNSESSISTAYSISARIYSDRISLQPGNFGNTVMFKSSERCCGSQLTNKPGFVQKSNLFERVIDCGSFHYDYHQSSTSTSRTLSNFQIRDLRLTSIDAINRTITVEWSSPFVGQTMEKNSVVEIKAFHKYTQHTDLPVTIKTDWEQNHADITIIPDIEQQQQRQQQQYSESMLNYETMNLYDTMAPPSSYEMQSQPSEPIESVKEVDEQRRTKPSNVVLVYLKSNVPIENTTALAIDDSKLPEGTRRDPLAAGPLTWIHILMICIGSALVLFIIILIIICVTIKKRRQSVTKQNQNIDYEIKKPAPIVETSGSGGGGNNGVAINDNGSSKQSDRSINTNGYYNGSQDESSLISNERNGAGSTMGNCIPLPNSNVSNNTSCSSVNTVDAYMNNNNGSNLDQPHHHPQPHPHHQLNHQMPPSAVKELNVATLLPNSWDAKELLDHWGRVQEAKQRQESPPIMRIHQNSSPSSIPSFGGGSSLDNYHQNQSNHNLHHNQYQMATAQPQMIQYDQHDAQHGHHHHHHSHHSQLPTEYNNHHHPHQTPFYSPYSNASSIWQHHQQQQQQAARQQQQQQQQQHQFNHHYDDNGLPEYSIVRKVHHANISQV
ncbi:hypothetical protein RDWZM_010328 [Blomia tropicalis]|uniref:Calcium-activated chloride channel N-terminal domain-containing protein n=1 Tax=Blomia tropicalis TaxID=40697 RepID=A0A9Q0RHL2_BLOTA|nr:hypothetical protein RDWZM_010328 [Blomia tropicalis]